MALQPRERRLNFIFERFLGYVSGWLRGGFRHTLGDGGGGLGDFDRPFLRGGFHGHSAFSILTDQWPVQLRAPVCRVGTRFRPSVAARDHVTNPETFAR